MKLQAAARLQQVLLAGPKADLMKAYNKAVKEANTAWGLVNEARSAKKPLKELLQKAKAADKRVEEADKALDDYENEVAMKRTNRK